jgi:hypothetical protein
MRLGVAASASAAGPQFVPSYRRRLLSPVSGGADPAGYFRASATAVAEAGGDAGAGGNSMANADSLLSPDYSDYGTVGRLGTGMGAAEGGAGDDGAAAAQRHAAGGALPSWVILARMRARRGAFGTATQQQGVGGSGAAGLLAAAGLSGALGLGVD